MGLLFSLIFIATLLLVLGGILAFPMYLPTLKQIAQQSVLRRRLMQAIFATFTLIVCLVGVAYIDAIMTNTLSSRVVERPFVAGSAQDELLTRELWLQNIVIPSVREDCYTADVVVCAVSKQIENSLTMNPNTEYTILLAHALTAVLGNILMVNHILGDNRKKKVPTLVTG